MLYTLSYQMYKCEHGLTTATERRAADKRAGEAAAALAAILGDLRAALLGTVRLRHRVRPGGGAANAKTARYRVLSSVR